MATPLPPTWASNAVRLRSWFYTYLIVWGIGLVATFSSSSPDLTPGIYVLLLAILPYIACIVYAYRVQSQLHAAGLYRHGAWHVLVGALLLNPLAFGLLIPDSVLWTARRVARKVGNAGGEMRQRRVHVASRENLHQNPGMSARLRVTALLEVILLLVGPQVTA